MIPGGARVVVRIPEHVRVSRAPGAGIRGDDWTGTLIHARQIEHHDHAYSYVIWDNLTPPGPFASWCALGQIGMCIEDPSWIEEVTDGR